MKLFQSSHDRDAELLSAYLDDQLSPGERAKLERRLQTDSHLRSTLNGLRHVKTRLTDLPKIKPPRNFTLTPQMAGRPARRPSPLIPALNWATALAATLFAVLIGADLVGVGRFAAPQAAPVPEVGLMQESAPAADEGFVADSATTAEMQDEASVKSMTATAGFTIESLPLVAATESPVEPLAGAPASGGDGPGVGGGGASDANPPASTVSAPSIASAASEASTESVDITAFAAETETPTPDASAQRITGETEVTSNQIPPAETQTPTVAQDLQVREFNSAASALSPLRLGQALAALLFVALFIASIALRRR
jgi:hypothetical protein